MGGWMDVEENADFYNIPANANDDLSFFDQL